MVTPELSRLIKPKSIPADPIEIEANAEECSALAARFGLQELYRLSAQITLTPTDRGIEAQGIFSAQWTQLCAISNTEIPEKAREEIALFFVPARAPDPASASTKSGSTKSGSTKSGSTEGSNTNHEEAIELSAQDLDEIEFTGDGFDLGEAVAQSLGLAIDPYASAPEADHLRKEAGLLDEGQNGAFAALAALKTQK